VKGKEKALRLVLSFPYSLFDQLSAILRRMRLCRNYFELFCRKRGLLKSRIINFFKNLGVKPFLKISIFSLISNCDTVSNADNADQAKAMKTPGLLLKKVAQLWSVKKSHLFPPFVVYTVCEPPLQLNVELIAAFHQESFLTAIETNGIVMPTAGID
jgi:hypothetical protein